MIATEIPVSCMLGRGPRALAAASRNSAVNQNRLPLPFSLMSEKGKGSRFWFTALFREAAARARGPRPSMQLTGISVAIIDDNRTNRTILERYVSSWGMRGRSFDSGHEALREIRRASHGETPFEVAIV